MADLLNGENSGVVVNVRPTDYRAGGESTIVYQAVTDGDWTKYKPTDEWQRRYLNNALGYDTNSCTDFSCMNSIELQITRMLHDGEIPDSVIEQMTALDWFDDNGMVNFSDWYNAILAGTTDAQGNTLYNPWEAVQKYGLLPQSKGSVPNDFTDVSQWFAKKPTPEQIRIGKKALELFDFKYEWVDIGDLNKWDLFDYHLKQAPLHVLVPTGKTWNNAVVTVPTPSYEGVNHAITLLSQDDTKHVILDHYNPFVKNLERGYYIPYALKGVVTLKKVPSTTPAFHYTFNVDLAYHNGATNEVHKLQEALQYLGYMKVGLFGIFGDATRTALASFQVASGILGNGGMNFGPKTRAAMNAKLSVPGKATVSYDITTNQPIMKSGIFTLDWGSIADAVVTAIVSAVIVGLVSLVGTVGFNLFTANWIMIGQNMANLGFIAGVVSLGQSFLSTNKGSVLGLTPPFN